MAKPVVDSETCIGCGLCVGSVPSAFEFDDEGKAKVIGECEDAELQEAIANCPVGAISE